MLPSAHDRAAAPTPSPGTGGRSIARRELGALTAQLRAATRLARLRVEGGDPAAAAALLGPILGSLTEGLDTADVREARELLEAVATP